MRFPRLHPALFLAGQAVIMWLMGGAGYGQAFHGPPSSAKPLHGELVSVEVASISGKRTLLWVSFYGSEPEIKFADVSIRAFDVTGKEIPITHQTKGDSKDDTSAILSFKRYRNDLNMDIYCLDEEEPRVAKVTVAWKGEETAFFQRLEARSADFRELHGGAVKIFVSGWPNDGPKLLEVEYFVTGDSEPEISYSHVKLSAFDEQGANIAITRVPGVEDTYLKDSFKNGRTFTGMYKLPEGSHPIARIKLSWGGQEVEFWGDELELNPDLTATPPPTVEPLAAPAFSARPGQVRPN